jgi:hypothetical protein
MNNTYIIERASNIAKNFKTIKIKYADENNEKNIYTCTDYIDNEDDFNFFIDANIKNMIADNNKIISYEVHNATFEDLIQFAETDIIETDNKIKFAFLQIMRLFTEQ